MTSVGHRMRVKFSLSILQRDHNIRSVLKF